MDKIENLQRILLNTEYDRKDKLIAILNYKDNDKLSLSSIKEVGTSCGLSEIKKWNLSEILSRAKPLTVKYPDGWGLTIEGKKHIQELFGNSTSTLSSAKALRTYLGKIKNSETLVFLDEAIKCLELDLYRSAVVLTWVGAISVLYDYVYKNKLLEFNAEGRRINTKWKDIQAIDDFSRIKESEFLDMIASISVLGKNVKEFLKNNCLGLRNSCGHPNSFKIGKHTVEAHIEHLILNVFSKY